MEISRKEGGKRIKALFIFNFNPPSTHWTFLEPSGDIPDCWSLFEYQPSISLRALLDQDGATT
jgi:hypothetical protein